MKSRRRCSKCNKLGHNIRTCGKSTLCKRTKKRKSKRKRKNPWSKKRKKHAKKRRRRKNPRHRSRHRGRSRWKMRSRWPQRRKPRFRRNIHTEYDFDPFESDIYGMRTEVFPPDVDQQVVNEMYAAFADYCVKPMAKAATKDMPGIRRMTHRGLRRALRDPQIKRKFMDFASDWMQLADRYMMGTD